MKLPVINRMLFIFKFHYFFSQAGIAPTQTAMPVYAQTLGFSNFVVGTIYTVLPLTGLVIKPALGAVADHFKWHKAVMLGSEFIIMLSYFCIQFIPSDFTPPINNHTTAVQTFCHSNSSLYLCNSDFGPRYLTIESQEQNLPCLVSCHLSQDSWDRLCQSTRHNLLCTSHDGNQRLSLTENEDCEVLPALWSSPSPSQSPYCLEASRKTSSCRMHCGEGNQSSWLKEAEDENQYQEDSVTFSQYQVYVFIFLMIGAFGGTAVTTTLADTICIAKVDPNLYGKQRLYGSIGYGVLSIVSGLIVDNISAADEPKNYTPAFYLCLGVLLLDIVVSYFYIQVEIPQRSENIKKDVWKSLMNFKVIVFLLWCAAMGISLGLTWTFLYLLLEALAKNTGVETVNSIKTIEGLTNGVQTFLGETPAFFFAGAVLNKIGHSHTMSIILFTIGVRFTIYSILSNPWYVLFVEPLQFYYGLFYCTMTSYANIVAAPGTEATMQSLMCAVCEGIGVAIGSFLGGYFFDWYGGNICFRIFGISFFVMAVINEGIELIYWIKGFESSGNEGTVQASQAVTSE